MATSEARAQKKGPRRPHRQHLGAKRKLRLPKGLNDAIDAGLEPIIDVMTPRAFVALMTMSSVELGRAFKRALRDELYEARRRATSPK